MLWGRDRPSERGPAPILAPRGKKKIFYSKSINFTYLKVKKNVFEFLYPENPHPTPFGARPETPTTTIRDFLKGLGSYDTNHSQKMNRTKLPVPYPFLFLSTALCVYNHDSFFSSI